MQKTKAQIQDEQVTALHGMTTGELSDEADAIQVMLLSFRRGDVAVEDFLDLMHRFTAVVTILTMREAGIGRQ